MVYNAANSQQSNTYQYLTDKKVRKLFEVPTYVHLLVCYLNKLQNARCDGKDSNVLPLNNNEMDFMSYINLGK